MIKNPLMRLILIFSVCILAGLACSMPGLSSPSLPPTAPPMNSTDAQNLQQQLQATLTNASGDVTITLTQAQLNGIISAEMAQQSEQVITDPSVVLTGGHMEVYGKVSQSGISTNTKVVLQPRVDADGNPKLDIVSINLGGLPVPDVLTQQIGASVDNTLSDYLASNSNGIKVKSITITEGKMTMTGTRTQP